MEQSVLILLAEDEPLIALSLKEALESAGFAVRYVMTADEAFDALSSRPDAFAGLVTDIRLQGDGNGWDLARRARELMPHVPVIYISGDSAHDHSAKGVPDSIMLQKPFADAQLVIALATIMNASPPQRPHYTS